jgi:hypothetical protein
MTLYQSIIQYLVILLVTRLTVSALKPLIASNFGSWTMSVVLGKKTRFFKLKKGGKKKKRERDLLRYLERIQMLKSSPHVAVPPQKAARSLDCAIKAAVPLMISAFKNSRFRS